MTALPAGIAAPPAAAIAANDAARPGVYTWSWHKRRAWMWQTLAVVCGMGFGLWHGLSMNAVDEALPLGLRGVLACLVIVNAGPLLAMLVRRLNLEPSIERWIVLTAIAGGVFIGAVAGEWADNYHDVLMRGHNGMAMPSPEAMRNFNEMLGDTLGNTPGWVILFLVCGGYDLPSYWSERRRNADARRARELTSLRAEKSVTDTQLAVLQAQIEPHFLFNTLASVRSLVATDPARAATTIDALSDYLRSTLPRFREGLEATSLESQVDICARYLDLMKIRMGGRLTVEIDVAGDAGRAAFPPLLLLPLVENAVKHGIEPKAGPGRIAIRARLLGDELEVAVEDDGAGLSSSPGSGVGLSNVRAQLAARFGTAASLEIEGREEGGVRAMINVPAETA